METVAIIEEVGRHGNIVRRHVIEQLPVRIGRGYDAEVFVDDPHVAAMHLEIRLSADGTLEAVDLGSLNGTRRLGDTARIRTTRIHSDDVFRIGQTQLRIRLPGQTVAAELPLQQRTWDRHPAVLIVSVGLLTSFSAWTSFANTFSTDTSAIYNAPIIAFLLVLVWAAVWSLVCRTLHGSSNFIAHGIVGFLGCAVFLFINTLTDYLNFAFDLRGFDLAWTFCLAAVFASMLYRHLRLTVRLSPRILASLVIFLAAAIFGGLEGLDAVGNANKPGLQSFGKSIKPSIFLFSQGVTPDQFVSFTEQLKAKADKDAGSMTP